MSTETLSSRAGDAALGGTGAGPESSPHSSRRAFPHLGNRLGRWGLRGVAIVYLGAMVGLPLAAVTARGFGDGLTSLRAAMASPGAAAALKLTLLTSLV